jgi:hypothetical protein
VGALSGIKSLVIFEGILLLFRQPKRAIEMIVGLPSLKQAVGVLVSTLLIVPSATPGPGVSV